MCNKLPVGHSLTHTLQTTGSHAQSFRFSGTLGELDSLHIFFLKIYIFNELLGDAELVVGGPYLKNYWLIGY